MFPRRSIATCTLLLLVSMASSALSLDCVHSMDFLQNNYCDDSGESLYSYPVASQAISNSRISSGFHGFEPYSPTSSPPVPMNCMGENVPISLSCDPSVTVLRAINSTGSGELNPAKRALELIGQTMINLENGIVLQPNEIIAIDNTFDRLQSYREMTTMCEQAIAGTPPGTDMYNSLIGVLTAINTPSETRPACPEPIVCSPANRCDDANECTTDLCYSDGSCEHDAVSDGGVCQADEQTECMSYTCALGSCVPEHAAQGTLCSDAGNLCLENTRCTSNGVCTGTSKVCSGVFTEPCVDHFCRLETGECDEKAIPDCVTCYRDEACSDIGGPCRQSFCGDDGACISVKLRDGLTCTPLASSEYSGHPDCVQHECHDGECTAESVETGTACSTDNQCYLSEFCDRIGSCVAKSIKDCSDEAPECTEGMCNPETQNCEFYPVQDCDATCASDTDCENTADDACTRMECGPAGKCVAVTKCDDGNRCTVSSCGEDNVCRHEPVLCDTDDPCLPRECDPLAGVCVYADPPCISTTPCERGYCSSNSSSSGAAECTYLSTGNCTHSCVEDTDCREVAGTCDLGFCGGDGYCFFIEKSCGNEIEGTCDTQKCNPINGRCEQVPDDTLCTGSNCSPPGLCQSGSCVTENSLNCNFPCVHTRAYWHDAKGDKCIVGAAGHPLIWPSQIDIRGATLILYDTDQLPTEDDTCLSVGSLCTTCTRDTEALLAPSNGTRDIESLFESNLRLYLLNVGWNLATDRLLSLGQLPESRIQELAAVAHDRTIWKKAEVLPLLQWAVEFNSGRGILPLCSGGSLDDTVDDMAALAELLQNYTGEDTEEGEVSLFDRVHNSTLFIVSISIAAAILLLIIVTGCIISRRERAGQGEFEMVDINKVYSDADEESDNLSPMSRDPIILDSSGDSENEKQKML